jgi:hypothetical protein
MADTEGARRSIRGFRSSDSSAQPLRLDKYTNTLQIIDYAHHEIHDGSHFTLAGSVSIGLNAAYDIQITTPNTTKWAHFLLEFDVTDTTNWYVYENVTIAQAGTGLTPWNNDRNSATTATVVTKGIANASVADANVDTAVAGATTLESGVVGANKTAGSVNRENEIILKQNEDYSIRFVGTAATTVHYRLNWYEHTNISV